MPSTIFAGSKVKALKDRLSLNDVTEIISVNADPSTGGGVTAPLGSIALDYLAGKVYKKTGSLATEWQELGAGLGGINYIKNPDAESGTTGWATYADAAGTAPVDGTGGSPNITWSRSTTTPLRGVADFNLVKDAANRQGQGVSYSFTIDAADQAKILTISCDYEVISGTYATGDLAVYVIQDPAGTPVVLQPAGYQVESATIGNKVRLAATFQTASNVTSYRLCIHVASTSASAYTLALDSVSVSPQQVVYGAPITDWQSFVPTGSWIANSTYTGRWRRVGDKMEIEYQIATSGAPTAAALTLSLPSGYSIDTSKLLDTVTGEQPLGRGSALDTGISYYPNLLCRYSSATSIDVQVDYQSAPGTAVYTAATPVTQAVPFTFGAGDKLWAFVSVPILGWSSSVVVSSSTDTRVVDLQVNNATSITPSGTIGTNFATAGTVNFNKTPTKDSHGAYSAGVFTVPVSGDYFVSSRIEMSHTSSTGSFVGMSVAVNGVEKVAQAIKPATTNAYPFVSGLVTGLNAGDLITIRLYGDASAKAFVASVVNDFTVHRLSGPSQIAASETVAARYLNTSGQTVTQPTVTILNYAVTDYDTHGAVTTGATWKFTAPVAGKYSVTGMVTCTNAVQVAGNRWIGQIFKNGSFHQTVGLKRFDAALTSSPDFNFVGEISLLAGDYIDLRIDPNVTATLSSTSGQNWIAIKRIGN